MNMDKTHPWKRTALDGLFYVLGSALYALSVNIFTAPNQIAPGGVTGIATLLNFVWGAPIGAMILLVNLPLLIAAWFRLGKAFTVRTLIVTILSSVVIDATAPFLPPFQGDKMLVALFGGVLAGAGLGLIYMRGATTGGTEVVARLLERKFRHIPIGRLILLVDALVVAASALVYRNVETALYAMVLIFVSTSLMDALVYGGDKGKMLLIMSRREQPGARRRGGARAEDRRRGARTDGTGRHHSERHRRLYRRGTAGASLCGAAVGNVSVAQHRDGHRSQCVYDCGIHRRGARRGLQSPK